MLSCEHSERMCQSCKFKRNNRANIVRKRAKKLEAMQARGGVCLDCGYDLTIHPEVGNFVHRPGEPRSNDCASDLLWKNAARFFEEIENCDLVCANCRVIREATEKEKQ